MKTYLTLTCKCYVRLTLLSLWKLITLPLKHELFNNLLLERSGNWAEFQKLHCYIHRRTAFVAFLKSTANLNAGCVGSSKRFKWAWNEHFSIKLRADLGPVNCGKSQNNRIVLSIQQHIAEFKRVITTLQLCEVTWNCRISTYLNRKNRTSKSFQSNLLIINRIIALIKG